MSFNFAKKFQDLSQKVSQAAEDAKLTEKFATLSTTIQQHTNDLAKDLPSLASKTQRLAQEKLGQITDISQLPAEYTELCSQVDNVKVVYESFLRVTNVYDQESYDYPNNIRESVNEGAHSIASKLTKLTHASSTADAQKILLASDTNSVPKTLNYALSNVAGSSAALLPTDETEDKKLLQEFASVQQHVGQLRLQQDVAIQTKFNKSIKDRLSNLADITRARKLVEQKRLEYDISRSALINARPDKENALRKEMETLEDEFAQAVDDAATVMNHFLESTSLSGELKQLITAQAEYHRQAAELLAGLV